MQDQRLIPTPLTVETAASKPIEVMEPAYPSRLRFVRTALFLVGMLLRSLLARLARRWARRYSALDSARRLRMFMEESGGLWVKAGQIIALRRDVFSEEFCTEIARLQDRACGFPFHYAKQMIESDLGKPIDAIFAEFDEQPMAAASIGQVYRARLHRPPIEVVVKVRRPNIAESFAADFRFLRMLVWIATRAQLGSAFRLEDMYWELEQAIAEELDYRQEAASLRRSRKNLRRSKIYVPKVYLDFSSDRVLVMELVRGVYMSEFLRTLATNPERLSTWLEENHISARRTGERLLFAHYKQLFEDNFYHCDLHPGNILLLRENRIVLIDFGSVGSTDSDNLSKQLQLFDAIATGDYNKVADLYLLMAPGLPNIEFAPIREKITQLYQQWEPRSRIKTLPYHQKSVANIVGQVVPVLTDAGVTADWNMLRSLRAQLTLDASLMGLLPGINYTKILKEYLTGMRRRQNKRTRSLKTLRGYAAKLSGMVTVPGKLAENTYFEGEYLRRRALKYEGYLSNASQIGGYIFLIFSRSFILVALFTAVAGLHRRYGVLKGIPGTYLYALFTRLPNLDPFVWLLATVTALYVSRQFIQITRIFNQPEPARVGGDRR